MKILYSTLDDKELETVRSIAPTVDFVAIESDDELDREIEDADAMFGLRLTSELLKKANRLRWTQIIAVGSETHLFPEFLESEVVLTNSRGTTAINISEHVFALILSFSRCLHMTRLRQQEKVWEDRPNLPVMEISGETLGIFGMGGIGLEVAKRAHAFGMRLLAVDPTPTATPEYVHGPWDPDKKRELLAQSDFVAVCCPHTPKTEGMIGAAEFKAMKPSAFLINIARGKIVDQAALVEALRNKEIAGAGLDALDPEPLPSDSPLWEMENVIITPHHAGQSPKSRKRVFALFCENLKRFVNNEPLVSVVDKDLRY